MAIRGNSPAENQFLKKVTEAIEDNLEDERFGVSELAAATGMSRSNLLRRIKSLTNLSVSQFIRQVRLQHALDMLKESSFTVSEISFKVGFSSTSYFIKCFREQYGYPPGEVARKASADPGSSLLLNRHQLVAIMFTDIEGYTALMQQDESKAVMYRNRHREVFNSQIEKYQGKILQYYGDGTLSTFQSAIDAVNCGIGMQLAFKEEPEIPVRIGIHSGDIIFTEDDIIGDGVNVASRIESLAVAGSIFISEKVYDEVKNQSGIKTVSMGTFELKNVEKPIEVYAIANEGLEVPKREMIKGKVKEGSQDGKHEAGPGVGPKSSRWIIPVLATLLIVAAVFIADHLNLFTPPEKAASDLRAGKKSIAVLPFINDSDDSTNIYIINGLMESILNNLQKIEDLRVISRTSVEKYRDNPKLISEIARELNVNYLIEGSGQKIGDKILLNIQLIGAPYDEHLWSEQYNRQVTDIFELQSDVARMIADQIQVFITPEEEERIKKIPTDNLEAWDFFVKGRELLFMEGWDNLRQSITMFRKAVSLDGDFAMAYADMAISFYMMDIFQSEKQYIDSIGIYSEKAVLLDPQLAQGLVAKAFYHINRGEHQLAVPYLEKALEYNPNSALVINTLADFYVNQFPDTEKYLYYALMGIRLNIASYDSATASITYLHVSNAFIQAGFVDEAKSYIDRSLNYNPDNLFAAYLRPFVMYAVDRDLQALRDNLIRVYSRDSTRLDILQEIGKVCYYQRDYDAAYRYYSGFVQAREQYGLNIYPGEDAKIGLVYREQGDMAGAEKLFRDYLEYAENDKSVYRDLSLGVYNACMGDIPRALDHLKRYSEAEVYNYWMVLFLKIDPLLDTLKGMKEYEQVLETIDRNFWDYHDRLKKSLVSEGLI